MASRKGLTKECRQHLLEAADCYIGQLCGDNFEPSHVYEEPVNEMVGRLLAATRQIQPNEKAVIMVDDNLYYRSMRAAWFKLARNYSLGFCQVFLLCTEEEAVRRNASRAFSVPESTIRTMAKKFEAPRDEPWEQLTVTVDGTPDSIEKVVAILEAASRQPWPPVITSPIREPVPASQMHIWDLELRAIVSKFIRQAQGEKSSKSQVQSWSVKVQKARQDVLAYLKGLDFGTLEMAADHTEVPNW
ncbi:hypothetical protein V5799_011168 [Amblyomma americanum]|uniref:Uncharacterized protein n=1 Tax=Amblyomma americanum TaxID=6943 RepID=A0AAQ4EHM3_AMBAM